jgi:hypothetical protein
MSQQQKPELDTTARSQNSNKQHKRRKRLIKSSTHIPHPVITRLSTTTVQTTLTTGNMQIAAPPDNFTHWGDHMGQKERDNLS